MFETLLAAAGGGMGLLNTGMGILGGLRDDDRNARAAADQRQADERGAERQMAFQSQESSTARQFAERMASTAHARQVADMRSAGLNPILSATGGHGASSPTVGAPSGSKAGAALQTGSGSGLGIFNSAQAAQRIKGELDVMEVTKRKMDAERRFTETSDREKFQQELLRREEIETEKVHRETMQEQLKGIRLEGAIDETKWGEILRYINRASPFTNSAGQIRNMFRQRGN